MAVNYVERIDGEVRIERAIISVSNKQGLAQLVPGLIRINPELIIYSTGGTFQALREILGRDGPKHLVQVSDYTGQPEMQGGLVKTLDFKIYLGLLSETYNQAHVADLRRAGAINLDMVVVNLYPFRETIADPEVRGVEKARANIDIGGPCLIRAASKNFLRVAALVDPRDYPEVLRELEESAGLLSLKTRFRLAQKGFAHTAEYDQAIAAYLAQAGREEWSSCYTLGPEQGTSRKGSS